MSTTQTPVSQSRRSPDKGTKKSRTGKKKSTKDEDDSNLTNRHFVSSFDKRLTYKAICDEFSQWKPWQRRIMLCGCTERTSRPLLLTLSTVVEPLFHRDYQICAHGEYPAHLMLPVISRSANSKSSVCSESSGEKIDSSENILVPNEKDACSNTELPLNAKNSSTGNSSRKKSRRMSKMQSNNATEVLLDSLDLQSKCIMHSHANPSHNLDSSGGPKKDKISSQKVRFPNLPSNQNFSIKKDILTDFRISLKKTYSHYLSWVNAERGDFVLELMSVCSQEDMNFFANCIMQRLSEKNDINRLPKSLFLNVFSYLNTKELSRCSQVCLKWKPISNHQSLWKKHCQRLAKQINQAGIFNKINAYSDTINWKKVYVELHSALEKLQSGKKLQEEMFSRMQNEQNGAHAMKTALDNAAMIAYYLGRTDVSTMDANALQEMIIQEANKTEDIDSEVSVESMKQTIEYDDKEDLDSVDGNMEVYSSGSLHMIVDDLKQVSNRNLESSEVAADVRHELLQAENKLNTTSSTTEENYTSIPIVGVKSLKRVRKLQGHEEPVICLQFDSKRVMTGSADRCVRIWDVRSGRNFHKLKGHKGGIRCLQFDENYIVTGSWDTTVMVWDVKLPFTLLHTISYHQGAVSCLEMTKEILVTGSHDKSICIWRRGTWELLKTTVGHSGPILTLSIISISSYNDHLVTGSMDRSVKLWNLTSLTNIHTFENHDSAVLTVKCCGNLLASGTAGGLITFWNVQSGNKEGAIAAHNGPVFSICFVSDKFISGGGDHLVKQWDLGTCTCIRSLTGHKGPVLCVRASQKRIISSSSDGSTRIWDVVCKLQQAGGFYDDMNKNVIESQVLVKPSEASV